MDQVTRTVYGAYLQTCLKLRVPHTIPQYSTLNEKLGIQSGVMPAPGVYPEYALWCWGNKGHTTQIGADGIGLSIAAQHRATDAALFNQLPFVLRTEQTDLSPTDRARYALRKTVVIGGQSYIAYYGKYFNKSSTVVQMQYRTNNNGTIVTTPFVPTADNLSPTPVVIPNTGVSTLTPDYVLSSAEVDMSLSAWEVAEMLNVAQIIYSDERYAIMSEIAVCSAVQKTIAVTQGGTTFNFNEAIGVQVASFIACANYLASSNSGVERIIDIGTNDPLFNIAT